MRSSRNSTPNAFSPDFLARLGERDEPVTAGEADVAGPWRVEEVPAPAGTAYGLFRLGERPDRGDRPAMVFHRRSLALLAAAVLPGTGREAAFRIARERTGEGFALETLDGEASGRMELFDENLVTALHVADCLCRSPHAFACFVEAAGAVLLERAGAILAERVP
jgi:hypothetical protein